jgi:hypothetical protein
MYGDLETMADQPNLPTAFLSIFTAAELRVIRVIFAAISAEGSDAERGFLWPQRNR